MICYGEVLGLQRCTIARRRYSNTENPSFPSSESFAPWDAAQVVCMYPSILDERATPTAGGSTSMVDSLVAYVRGAAMLPGVAGGINV